MIHPLRIYDQRLKQNSVGHMQIYDRLIVNVGDFFFTITLIWFDIFKLTSALHRGSRVRVKKIDVSNLYCILYMYKITPSRSSLSFWWCSNLIIFIN